jgi:hypothetical protein
VVGRVYVVEAENEVGSLPYVPPALALATKPSNTSSCLSFSLIGEGGKLILRLGASERRIYLFRGDGVDEGVTVRRDRRVLDGSTCERAACGIVSNEKK